MTKAKSIEDIREHMKKGGRVIGRSFAHKLRGEVESITAHDEFVVRCMSGQMEGAYNIWSFDQADDWQLVALKEKEPQKRTEQKWRSIEGTLVPNKELPGLLGKALGKRISKAFESAPPLMDGIRELQQSGKMEAFRKKLMFGYPLTLEEQNELWFAVTGERIEYGRRCVVCDGQGKLKSNSGDKRPGYEYTGCPGCSDGYVVTPTWKRELSNC